MNLSALKLIKKFEGKCLAPYQCLAGYWTIGWGHRLMKHESFRHITDAEAEDLLKKDLFQCERVLNRLIRTPLAEHQEAALLSFLFNVGAAAFQRSTLRMKVNRADHEDVPYEFKRWVWAKGRKVPGLVMRRTIEAGWYEGNTSVKFVNF